MATQLFSVVKVAGAAGEWVWERLGEWAAARRADDVGVWETDQWPAEVRKRADALADLLRTHGTAPPVAHFVEWGDSWSMGDEAVRWLTPTGGPSPARVFGDGYELCGYRLPDGGALDRHLAGDRKHQFPETDWFVRRLREAVESWSDVCDRATLLVLRRVTAPSLTDEEMVAALQSVPGWLSGGG